MTEQFRVRKSGPRVGIVETIDGKQIVCNVAVPYNDDLRGHAVTKQRANLFAAAPDMLAALEKARAEFCMLRREYEAKRLGAEFIERFQYLENEAAAAIAKAKGESI